MSASVLRPTRGAIVGLGAMGSNHLRVAAGIPGVTVAAVVDPSTDRRARALTVAPDATGYANLGEALAAQRLDWVCLAVPVGLIPPLAAEAIAAGVHLLVEKPTAPSVLEARTMVQAASDRGLVLAVGHIERCNPAVIALKAKLDEGLIGNVLQLSARRVSPFPGREGSQGVALDLSTHDIDVMRFLTGDEVATVQGTTSTLLSENPAHEDLLAATLRFDGGPIGLLETNWASPTKVRQLTVLGERGMFVVDYLTQDLVLHSHPSRTTTWDHLAAIRGGGEGDMIRFALERREPLRVEWEQFLRAVDSGGEAPISGYDGLAALSIALAIRESAADGNPVVPAYRSEETFTA